MTNDASSVRKGKRGTKGNWLAVGGKEMGVLRALSIVFILQQIILDAADVLACPD